MSESEHCIYILECSDGSLYTGYTNRLAHRLETHQAGKGAKYTRARLPVKLVYCETCATKSEALKREYAVKQLVREDKLKLVRSYAREENDERTSQL